MSTYPQFGEVLLRESLVETDAEVVVVKSVV